MKAVKVKLGAKAGAKVASKIEIKDLADKFVELDAQISKTEQKAAPLRQEQDALKKQILEYANTVLGEDETLTLPVNGKELSIGKRGSSRVITAIDKVIKFMSTETFLKVAKVSLSDIDKYLRPEEIEQCVTTQRTDTRIIKIR